MNEELGTAENRVQTMETKSRLSASAYISLTDY